MPKTTTEGDISHLFKHRPSSEELFAKWRAEDRRDGTLRRSRAYRHPSERDISDMPGAPKGWPRKGQGCL